VRDSFSRWFGVGLILIGGLSALAAQGATAVSAASTGGAYQPVAPTRILDTRDHRGPLGPGASLNLQVAGTARVPAGATAVVLNVTATDTTSAGYLTLYPAGEAAPVASNLNWAAGGTVANLAIVPVGSGGAVTIRNASGRADVLVDLQGYFAPVGSASGYYVPLTPTRIADTRPLSGEPLSGQGLGPRSELSVPVAGHGGVPSDGATAVVLNVTATSTTRAGFLAVYPQGVAWPGTSTLNWTAGETVAGRVVVPLGAGGSVAVYNQSGSTELVVDVSGYFTSAAATPGASLFYPLPPRRMLDTRVDGGTLGTGQSLLAQMAGVGPVAGQASAVVANLTVTDTSASSFLTAGPQPSVANSSDLNWTAGTTAANLDIATLSSSGDLGLYNAYGRADAVVDVFGYFVPNYSTGSAPATCSGLTVAVTNAPSPGGQISVSVQASCPSGTTPAYTFWYQAPGATGWQLGAASISDSTFGYPSRAMVVGTYRILVWASSQAGVFQGVEASAATTVTNNPATNVPDSFAGTCYADGYTSSACLQAVLAAIGAAQAGEGVPALKLPSNFASLSQPLQEFVLADAERVSRGLPAIPGLTQAADKNALLGAQTSSDPNGLQVRGAIGFASVWAEDYGAAGATFDWMYNDGPGSNNEDCTTADSAGCWGHRDNILLNTSSGTWAAPAGYSWVGGAACAPIGGIGYFNSCTLEWVLVPSSSVSYQYSWAQALAAGA
jgi:hypothetical protein